jgi:thiamine-phosphate pyrophosphorylase
VTRRLEGRPVVYCVTDRKRLPNPSITALVEHVRTVVHAGVDAVQVRERDLDDRTLTDLVRAAVDAARDRRVSILVNDRVDVALAAGADGVHLREDSIAAWRIRSLVPEAFVIGRSVHSAADAEKVERAGGCDYLLFGTVYSSPGKPDRAAAGEEALADVCRRVTLPVLAIGGVDESRTPTLAATGAAGFAAIGAFVADDVRILAERVRAMRRAFD